MIQPNELRTGNWVEHRGDFIQVESVHPKGINVEADSFGGDHPGASLDCIGFDQLKPIPLTWGILHNAGFKNVLGYFDNGDMRFSMEGGLWACSLGEDYNAYTLPNCPQNLHQLQNIYFALTGVELPINLKELQQA